MTEETTIGELIARCKPNTIIDVFFHDPDGVDRIPTQLGYRPTVTDLRRNTWLCSQPVSRREHFNSMTISSGWTFYVPSPFDPAAFDEAEHDDGRD